jgi:hypothetical protein
LSVPRLFKTFGTVALCPITLPAHTSATVALRSRSPQPKPAAMSGKGAKGLSGKGAKGTIGGEKKGDKKKPISRSARAGLQFPVGRIHRLLKVSRRQAGPAVDA